MIWLAHLQQFPADIVLTTLRNWPKRQDGQWWPTWHEVQKELEAMTGGRRLLAEHIRSGACLPPPPPEDERDNSPEGVARREDLARRVRDRHGIKQPGGEGVSDSEAIPEAKRRELEQAVQVQADRIKAEGLPKLSVEALRSVLPDIAEQYDEWAAERDDRSAA